MDINTPGQLAAALGHAPTEPQWRTGPGERIPPHRFGKDHWSTFAYVETRIIDHHGVLDHDHMRCDADRHPLMASAKRLRSTFKSGPVDKYPTRIKGAAPRQDGTWPTEERPDHDDYDCLDDLMAAGLLEVHMPRADRDRDVYVTRHGKAVTSGMVGRPGESTPRPSFTTGMDELALAAAAVFTLTDLGRKVAGELRAWKGGGHNYHQFAPTSLAGATVQE